MTLERDPAMAAWVRDRMGHPRQSLSFHTNGRLTIRLTVAETRDLIGWALSFGSDGRVSGPDTLLHVVRGEARKLVASK